MKKKLADVLWEAANTCLPAHSSFDLASYSCNAALRAEFHGIPMKAAKDEIGQRVNRHGSVTHQFLNDLGCTRSPLGGFGKHEPGEIRQGVRYMWLLLAMHVAEDEGIMVEVAG